MPRAHRVGDVDAAGHRAVSGSPNVFINGGPTLGGAVATALGIPDTVMINDDMARMILEDRANELALGNDPDQNEALESYGGGSPDGVNPITGQTGVQPAPGSAAQAQGDDSVGTPPPTGSAEPSEWLNWQAHVNPNVLPEVREKLIVLAQSIGRPLSLNSGYRPPEYNARIGGAKRSMHMQRKAADVQWPIAGTEGKKQFMQKAIDAGFTGIGAYNSFMHVDIGAKRCWGPSGGRASMYAEFVQLLRQNGFTV
jgi:hypothetical protein